MSRSQGTGEVTTSDLAAEARAAGARARRFGALYSAEHHVRVWRRYLGVNVASAIGTPVMYLFAFGVGLGVLVNANAGPGGVDGVSYLAVIGSLLAMRIHAVGRGRVAPPQVLETVFPGLKAAEREAAIARHRIEDGKSAKLYVRGGGLTPGDRSVIREFAQMPESERMQLVKRCRGVTSGGYDAALVKLCRLLQTASR